MKPWVISASGWILGIAGLGTFGYSVVMQTGIQKQMNATMERVDTAIVSTGDIVHQTSYVLSPLVSTTKALNLVEQREVAATTNLTVMNNELGSVARTEQSLIYGLDSLNQSIDIVSKSLDVMQNLNQQLLSVSLSSEAEGQNESAQMQKLNTMTAASISQLHKLNQKFSALGILP